MKRYGDLWDSVIDIDNIKLAHENAKKGKSHYREVKMVEGDLDKYCLSIQEMLKEGFSTSRYRVEDIWDGNKYRTIHKLPYYPDRIIQHALMNIVGAIFYPTLIRDTFQSIPNRGTSDAVKRVRGCLDNTSPRYALKVDVHKFYPSIDNEVMKSVVRRKIKCDKTLALFDDIIDSTEGLPIGNYTSQILGNLYLSSIDWWAKQEMMPLGYFRYCDDIIVFSNSKQELHRIKIRMDDHMSELKLSLKPSWTISDISKDGIDFVGYVFYNDFTRMRKKTKDKMISTFKEVEQDLPDNVERNLSRVMAYKGWTNRIHVNNLFYTHIPDIVRKIYPNQF